MPYFQTVYSLRSTARDSRFEKVCVAAQGMRRVLGRPRYSKEAVFYVMDRLIHSSSHLLIRRERCLECLTNTAKDDRHSDSKTRKTSSVFKHQ